MSVTVHPSGLPGLPALVTSAYPRPWLPCSCCGPARLDDRAAGRERRSGRSRVSRRVVGVTLDNLEHLPKSCRRCVYWELAPHLKHQAEEFGATEVEKEAWVSSVLLEWGSCGRIVYSDTLPVGFVLYAPPNAVPRALAFPTSPPSADAVLL